MAETPDLVRIYLTLDPLASGEIPEVWAEIRGYGAYHGSGIERVCSFPEGLAWHRTRSAAESYARQLQQARIDVLRAEIDRVERLRFGRHGQR